MKWVRKEEGEKLSEMERGKVGVEEWVKEWVEEWVEE